MRIEADDLSRPQVHALLAEHLHHMHQLSPAEQVFALDLDRLRQPGISFWTVWDDAGTRLLGCGALKVLSATEGELKSMRTPQALRRQGAGRLLLQHIVATARQRGQARLWLETGTHPDFAPAHRLYQGAGFRFCGPFGDYRANPHSCFMVLDLGGPAG